jgi:hypothetical protein
MFTAKILVDLWMVGFAMAIVLQTILQRNLASNTSWSYAPGWQREIALWNIGIIAVIFLVRGNGTSVDDRFLPALAFLSLMLGTNHLVAALKDRSKIGHWAGVIGNYFGVAVFLAFKIQ